MFPSEIRKITIAHPELHKIPTLRRWLYSNSTQGNPGEMDLYRVTAIANRLARSLISISGSAIRSGLNKKLGSFVAALGRSSTHHKLVKLPYIERLIRQYGILLHVIERKA